MKPRALVVFVVLGWWVGVSICPSEASEIVLPDDAIQQIYTTIIQQPQPRPVYRQVVKDLRELTQLCQLAGHHLRTDDQVEDTCHLIESKAAELKRDRTLLAHELSAWKAKPAKERRAPRRDPKAVTTEALQKLSALQQKLEQLIHAADHHEGKTHVAAHQELHRALDEILDQLGSTGPLEPIAPLPPFQPTFGFYEPKPRAPRERGTVMLPIFQAGTNRV